MQSRSADHIITLEEFRLCARNCNLGIPDEAIPALFADLDTNNTGGITLDEFTDNVRASLATHQVLPPASHDGAVLLFIVVRTAKRLRCHCGASTNDVSVRAWTRCAVSIALGNPRTWWQSSSKASSHRALLPLPLLGLVWH